MNFIDKRLIILGLELRLSSGLSGKFVYLCSSIFGKYYRVYSE